MKENKAEIFNQKAQSQDNQADKIIESLELTFGFNVLDFGSGGGFFSLKFSKIVGKYGVIYCLDNSPDLLNYIKNSSQEKNIETILFDGKNIPLNEKSLDLIFMRNVTHHLKNRSVIFEHLRKFLKDEGKFAIIDYNKGNFLSFHGVLGHYVHKKDIISEMKAAGFKIYKEFDFLKFQHFTIFIKQ
jgi:ubiquinone/menaquinone biosynthesis C-methylase UbiE